MPAGPDVRPVLIRPARADDQVELERLQEIERRAGALFLDEGLPEIAADDPPGIDELAAARLLLVATDDADVPVAYARVELVDGHAHLEQLSVDPVVGRRGIGGRLLEATVAWAIERGDDLITLTTFADVAFNAPYYRRRGFEDVAVADRPPGLAALVAAEAAHGLDPGRRVTMRRRLSAADERT